MTDTAIFLSGLFVTGLGILFLIFTYYEVKRSERITDPLPPEMMPTTTDSREMAKTNSR